MAKSKTTPKENKSSKPKKAATPAAAKLAAAAPSAPHIDIGLDLADRKKIADGLSRFLADAYTLYL